MSKKKSMRINWKIIFLLGTCLILIASVYAGFAAYERRVQPSAPGRLAWLMMTEAAACAAVSALILASTLRTFFFGTHTIIKKGKKIAEQECASLRNAMAEMSMGNMSIRTKIKTKPLPAMTDPALNRFAGIMNDISSQIQDASKEFNSITEIPCKRLCYVGADSFLEGWHCGEAMGELLKGKGQVGIILGNFKAVNAILRKKGFESALRKKYQNITVVDVREDLQKEEGTYACTVDMIKRNPGLSGLYIAHGATPYGAANAVVENGKNEQIRIVSHDLTDKNMRCIQKGWMSAALNQNPFIQGHDPVIHLYNHLVAGWQPLAPRLLTHLEVVTPANYMQYWDEGKGLIQTQAMMDQLTAPVDRLPSKPLRIAVIGTEATEFWKPVKEGVQLAAQRLKLLNTTVDWIVPQEKNTIFDMRIYGRAVEKAVLDGYHGIAAVVYFQDMVPVINEAVAKGVPVVSYNTEPFSMRNLIYTIMQQAEKLMGLSENLASNSQQVSMATGQINLSMGQIAQGAVSQNTQVKQTEQVLESLLSNIDQVNREVKDSAASAEQTARAVSSGTDAMDKTLGGIQSIEESVEATSKIVGELRMHSERIDTVVELINDIASHVNMLSLNAAIEATRAGEYGKGFAVVSNEIRKLARSTAEATGEVTRLVETVQSGIQNVGKSMETGLEKVRNSVKLTDVAKDALGSIRDLVETNKNRMGKIAAAIGEMQKFSQQVGDAMGGVTSVSERNAQAVEEIRAATEEMNQQFKEVASLARSLEKLAQSEQELLAKFNVSIK